MMPNMLRSGTARAFLMLVALCLIFIGAALAMRVTLGPATVFSIMQNFASLGPVALGLGLTMLIREFDISISGMFGLGGCVAVLVGLFNPWLGLLAALAVGCTGGALQGYVIVRSGLGSVPVTLGGLLIFGGLAHVLTGSRSLPFGNLDMALLMNEPIVGFFSARSLVALGVFAIAALVITWTRTGRNMIALGSAPHAAAATGINATAITVGVFSTSGMLAALSGGLLSFSLSAASPSGLSDIAIPAVAAVILGGASLLGGAGRPLGTAAGALILCVLRTGLTTLGVPSFMQDLATGLTLLAVAVADGERLAVLSYLLTNAFRRQSPEEHIRKIRLP